MRYTVKEMSDLSKVTIKTLHHYHKIGLLVPLEVSEAGYRLYGQKEIERLQEILFYRELEFPLGEIKRLLDGAQDRLRILESQRELIREKQRRMERLSVTLEASIDSEREGASLPAAALFSGFGTAEAWEAALAEQSRHLKETYDFELPGADAIDPVRMNRQAAEAARFMDEMARALREGRAHDDEEAHARIERHLAARAAEGQPASPDDFAGQSRFFLGDVFHRGMLESMQTGLSYYLCFAAESYAEASRRAS
ncbi:DNA-binding transcriptional regulator, MerR family [Cohnella sp. OV330]|uniref:MerR family transcriptional regulator n=1 Tax=Cohnella sp. OV330 TaxID=1855288 RepID=UPI0008F36618|nr:MerR family transcriptional regulator [Cohnella sp. OV330]SFB54686.1 DNA-binding transcriptional regulator, MerR family [Cohnella sp. OV330]